MRQWTELQHQQAALRAHLNRPWQYSTGPRTLLGKLKSSRNSYKHGSFSYEKQLLRWYVRLSVMRIKQIKTHLAYQNQKRENELIAKYGIHRPSKPDRMAFYPYFRVHPLEKGLHKGRQPPKKEVNEGQK